jgi:hypothetical protein
MKNNKQQKSEKLFERVIVINFDGTSYSRNMTVDEIEIYKKKGYVKYHDQQTFIDFQYVPLISSNYLRGLVMGAKSRINF